MTDYDTKNFGPLYGKSWFEKRMRVHQQWWGWHRLKRFMGQLRPGKPFPVLTTEELREPSSSNFVADGIHSVAVKTPGLSSDPHFGHLVSSLPMAVNLFGILLNPKSAMTCTTPLDQVWRNIQTPFAPAELASKLVGALLGHSANVLRVDFEIPGRLKLKVDQRPLGDKTSADVLIEVEDNEGLTLIVVETKLTESLTNGGNLLDPTKGYREVFDAPGSPFKCPLSVKLCDYLTKAKLGQWTRNHLLAASLGQTGRYNRHLYWVVFPNSHSQAVAAVPRYSALLRDPNRTFGAFTLEDIVAKWDPFLDEDTMEWRQKFSDRYLTLDGSRLLWETLTNKDAKHE